MRLLGIGRVPRPNVIASSCHMSNLPSFTPKKPVTIHGKTLGILLLGDGCISFWCGKSWWSTKPNQISCPFASNLLISCELTLQSLGDLVFEPDKGNSTNQFSLPLNPYTEEGSTLGQQAPFGQGYHDEEIFAPKAELFLSVSWLNLFWQGDLVILCNTYPPVLFWGVPSPRVCLSGRKCTSSGPKTMESRPFRIYCQIIQTSYAKLNVCKTPCLQAKRASGRFKQKYASGFDQITNQRELEAYTSFKLFVMIVNSC